MKFKIKNFVEAEQFLASHVPKTSTQTFPGEIGLKRAKYFLHLLGQPQENIKVIHVAGTSGKGSTCYLISSLLASQGFKIGFYQSPHLLDVTERFQINGKKISQKEFVSYLNKIISVINKLDLTYFEILVGLAFYIFNDKKVDYAVIETGLGGKYDGTNIVSRQDKLSVLTKIGLDHTNILGKTIEKIVLQKAMIINKNSQAVSIHQDPNAEKVIWEVVRNQKAKLFFVPPMSFLRRRELDPLLRGDDNIIAIIQNLNLIGEYQKENASLALAAVNYLSQRDNFFIDKAIVNKVFETAHFPGRFDVKKIVSSGKQTQKTVIFDGAHNPQKMKAFIDSLVQKYPEKKFNFLLAFKKGKEYQSMLKIIISKAASIILTNFFTENQDMINASEEPKVVGKYLKKIGFNNFEINLSLEKAWKYILTKKDPIVVVGSLYLVGEIFRLIKVNK